MMSAVVGLPVTRGATNSVCCYQVYCERKKQPPEQFPEAREQTRPTPPAFTTAAPPESVSTLLLACPPFQRPPPAAAFVRIQPTDKPATRKRVQCAHGCL